MEPYMPIYDHTCIYIYIYIYIYGSVFFLRLLRAIHDVSRFKLNHA